GLVDDEDLVVAGGGDGELQPGGHARGVRPHRELDEVADSGEVDDVVVLRLDLLARQAEGEATQDDVPLTGEVADEGGPDAQHAGPGRGVDRAAGRGGQSDDRPHQGALARAVGTDDADRV